jgi:penicillin amidase
MRNLRTLAGRRAKIFFSLLSAAGVGVTGLAIGWRYLLQRSVSRNSGQLRIRGISNPVEIIRDKWGVPHIYAKNEQDLFFAQGYVHAQDRLFQMDSHRRVGVGRISEISGSSGLATDRYARYFGWKRAAEAQVSGMSAEVRSVMDAYCAGVNAFIAHEKLPVEFLIMAYRPEPWCFVDTASWGAVLAWGLSVNWESELIRALLLEHLGPERTVDLTTLYDDGYQTIIPDEMVGSRLAASFLLDYSEAIEHLPLGTIPAGKGIGSNSWVMNGQHTVSGRPILANDPHLPPVFPALWYENHLVGGRFNVTGFTMPGVPGVIIGHNEHISWGLTNAFPDVQDVYIERFHPDDPTLYEVNGNWRKAEVVKEEIKVRGQKPVVDEVRYTRHGPVFSDLLAEESQDLTLRWSSYSENDHLRAVLGINVAANWAEFREALRYWGFPSQNVVYADRRDNIAYVMPGLVPRRRKGSGILPVPGWDDTYEWEGWIAFDELPQSFNPVEGVVITANNRVHGDSYPHFLTSEWLPECRANRIAELIDLNRPLTLADNGRIQADTVSLQARRFLGFALPRIDLGKISQPKVERVLQLLQAWDYDMHVNMVEPTLFWGWLTYFTEAVYLQAKGD